MISRNLARKIANDEDVDVKFSLASYQSDVTEIPVDLPGIDIRGIRKDQYQAMLQLDQVVWDGGNIRARKEVTRATSEVDKQKLEVDMYAINERVNQLFLASCY